MNPSPERDAIEQHTACGVDYNSGADIRAFLAGQNLGIRKKWGQHFLVNPGARAALAEALAIQNGEGVWEIGPGIGAMTALLLEKGAKVKAFEIDPGFAGIVRGLFTGAAFTLVPGDVLKTWKSHNDDSRFLLGNLPYTIAAVLMGNLIEGGRFFSRMVITVQKEVAARMAARPGTKDYSSISALCASAYTVKPLMNLKAASFYPPPRVDSAALLFQRNEGRTTPLLFAPLVRALFVSRRKTIANNLEHFLSFSGIVKGNRLCGEIAARALERCGIPPRERAEKLGWEAFAALAGTLEGFRNDHSGTR